MDNKYEKDFFFRVSRGDVPGVSAVIIDGKIEDLDIANGTPEIWSGHTAQNAWNGPLSTAETMDIVSSSANDTAAGSGAQTIRISGLDGSYNTVAETLNLSGATPVTSVNSYVMLTAAVCLGQGTDFGSNQGNITVTSTTTGDVHAYVPLGEGLARNGFYMVPADKNAMIIGTMEFNAAKISGGGGTPELELKVTVQQFGLSQNLWLPLELDTGVNNELSIPQYVQARSFPAQSLIRFKASTDTNNTKVRCRAHLLVWDI